MNDQTPQTTATPTGAASALNDGLGVALPPGFSFSFHVSNDELATAIAYAFDRCDQKYVGGYTTGNTEPGKVMLEHLKSLLEIQRARAGFIETPNMRGFAAIRIATLREREACAKVVETESMPLWAESCDTRDVLASAIRMRSDT